MIIRGRQILSIFIPFHANYDYSAFYQLMDNAITSKYFFHRPCFVKLCFNVLHIFIFTYMHSMALQQTKLAQQHT